MLTKLPCGKLKIAVDYKHDGKVSSLSHTLSLFQVRHPLLLPSDLVSSLKIAVDYKHDGKVSTLALSLCSCTLCSCKVSTLVLSLCSCTVDYTHDGKVSTPPLLPLMGPKRLTQS